MSCCGPITIGGRYGCSGHYRLLMRQRAAKGLGVTRQQLHKIIAGRSAITPEMAVRLEKAIGGSADGWMRMQINFDLAQVRERQSTFKVKRFAPKVA